ncbi:MAG TPA: OsmC family protein [Casimicrobiaceae bacterium]|nr:OsmC family protein [Casimicrobiaceae bacterium]
MKARIKWTEGMSFVAETGSGHAVVVDGAPEHGGRNLGARPMELVLAGTAVCTAFDVVLILKKARQPVADCVVDAEGDRADEPPRVFTRIRFTFTIAGRGLDARAVERAVALSRDKYCSATAMVAKTARIETEIRIVEGDRVPLAMAATGDAAPE